MRVNTDFGALHALTLANPLIWLPFGQGTFCPPKNALTPQFHRKPGIGRFFEAAVIPPYGTHATSGGRHQQVDVPTAKTVRGPVTVLVVAIPEGLTGRACAGRGGSRHCDRDAVYLLDFDAENTTADL